MEVTLTPEQEEALSKFAARLGRPKADLVAEAIGSYLEHEHQVAMLRAEIQIGIDEMDRGEFIELTPESMRELVDEICHEGREEFKGRKQSA